MRIKTKFFALLLASLLVLGTMPVAALAEEGDTTYTITSDIEDQKFVAGSTDGTIVNVTLSGDGIGTGYSNVLLKVTITEKPTDATLKLLAEDTSHLVWDVAAVGYWGPSDGFPVTADYNETTPFTVKADKPGDYTAKIELIDKSNGDAVLAETELTINVDSGYTITADAVGKTFTANSKDGTKINVTLKGDAVAATYTNVRFKVGTEGPAGASLELWATDTADKEWNVAEIGFWGPSEGFPIAADYDVTTPFTVKADKPGDYTVTVQLIDINAADAVLATEKMTFTVDEMPSMNVSVAKLDPAGLNKEWSHYEGAAWNLENVEVSHDKDTNIVTITGPLAELKAYESDDPHQAIEYGEQSWIALAVDTGEESIIGVSYGTYELKEDDVAEAATVGLGDGWFVLWVRAEALVDEDMTFTLSTEGKAETTITITFADTSELDPMTATVDIVWEPIWNNDIWPDWPSRDKAVGNLDKILGVDKEDNYIKIWAPFDDLEAYVSDNEDQAEAYGSQRWIALEVNTGVNDITTVEYNGTPLVAADVAEAGAAGLEGGSFILWVRAEALMEEAITFTLSTAGKAETTVTIEFVDAYLLIFDAGDGRFKAGTEDESRFGWWLVPKDYQLDADELREPTRSGYAFAGWYKDEELTEAWNYEEDAVTENTTLYAKWFAPDYSELETAIAAAEAAKGGVVTSADGTDVAIGANWVTEAVMDALNDAIDAAQAMVDDDTATAQGDIDDAIAALNGAVETFETAKADGTKVPAPLTYTVTFNSNGGSAVANQTIQSGSKATKPANPTKAGYTFGGWYSDDALKNAWDFNTAITKDTTLYAKWTSNGGG
ncbi:MAG: InlB B-repeat-containing protein, partial [Eubacteriales bacterium]|nr:InlB B-repeat-containing protein [Eubacteriales bacterium]